ncbi:Cyclic di-GMP phosphodiesterase Gmr [Tritonibacter multivorans]|uniref:Cyclic di-GMP phosphodiesterase Gmr n=1 Tax=Tritonibacter multivorans TaxID=928856 RepID=A0A0P1GQU7_9RHOB|nr:EAL domain-containing protein [Tritonibacter multivorans]MDA7421175.1 EAL domain-containing protein [Tritonibacter multivorans]CUH77575.1 Cyclic di-GMP phosphodiesterase Gmr [Tritonibacter multivorans]SFD33886.1 diguanylate cyclase (GGDEF) domain-containing protein [Tritonibacter multivorans]
MQSVEELRDILSQLQEELKSRREQAAQSELLLSGIESLLSTEAGSDPFAIAFQSLGCILQHDDALALVAERRTEARGKSGDDLLCVSATQKSALGRRVQPDKILKKVLAGRVASGLAGAASPIVTGEDRAALYLPINFGETRGIVVLWRNADKDGFGRQDIALGRRFAPLTNQALSMRDRARTEETNRMLRVQSRELEKQAHFDTLTGLPNRIKIDMILEDAIANGGADDRFALAFLDVNKFKRVNDYYGHEIGDALLLSVAERLNTHLGEGDVAARISGDEFLLLIRSVPDRAELGFFIDHLAEVLSNTHSLRGFLIDASSAIGVSRFPEDGTDQVQLRRAADMAMYRSKASGGALPVIFDAGMAHELTAKMELETRLHDAIEREDFVPFFQPKIDIRNGALHGFEVLLRWRTGEAEYTAPGAFLSTAEEQGLLDRIMFQAVRKLVDDLPLLTGRFGRKVKLSINVTPTQLKDREFMKRLLALLSSAELRGRLVLEITEDEALDVELFRTHIQPELARNEILVSIDDFGTGYSNLAQLAALEAYELKIDRALIAGIHRDPAKQQIVSMICAIARNAGEKTVAEGVEDPEDLDFLRHHTAVDMVQGYIFARPMPLADLLVYRFPDAAWDKPAHSA